MDRIAGNTRMYTEHHAACSAVARDENADPRDLEALYVEGTHRLYVVMNPSCPAHLLAHAAAYHDDEWSVLFSVAHARNLTPDAARILLRVNVDDVSSELTADEARAILRDRVLRNPALSFEFLMEECDETFDGDLAAVASNMNSPRDFIESMAKHPKSEVRLGAARSINISQETLLSMASRRNETIAVRQAIAASPRADAAVYRALVASLDFSARQDDALAHEMLRRRQVPFDIRLDLMTLAAGRRRAYSTPSAFTAAATADELRLAMDQRATLGTESRVALARAVAARTDELFGFAQHNSEALDYLKGFDDWWRMTPASPEVELAKAIYRD